MLPSTQVKLDIAIIICLVLIIIITASWQLGQFQKEKNNAEPNVVIMALVIVFAFIVLARHLLRSISVNLWNSAIRSYINIQKQRRGRFELQAHRYGQLDSSRQEIRLLTIEPGSAPDPILCTLRTTVLGEVDCDYEALSYTWGSALNAREIILDGMPFSITRNLNSALKHLRHAENKRTLWIDAVCINQFKTDERSQQVAIMRHIYQHASSVVIWLGGASADSDVAFDFMAQDTDDEILNNSIGNDDYLDQWKAIRRLFTREYWNRVWIIQEVAMSTSPTIQCGNRTTNWETVVRHDSAWQRQRRLKFSSQGTFFEAVDKSDRGPLRTFRRTIGPYLLDSTRREVTDRRKGRANGDVNADATSPNTLLGLIQTHWMANATDPRDQIFALFGLASDRETLEELGFRVDYGLELSNVYRMLVRSLFKKTGKIDIIGFAGIPDQDEASTISKKIQTVSSWIPLWSSAVLSKLHLAQINMRHGYTAAGATKAVVHFEDGTLTIRGRIVGRIWELGPRSSNYRTSTFTNSDLKKVTADIKSYHAFAVKVIRAISDSGMEGWQNHLSTNLNNFWRVLVCDRTLDGFISPDDWDYQFRAIVDGALYLPEEITSRSGFNLPDFIRPYQEAVLHTMSSRQLFVTNCGDFGIGPSDLDATKDEVVVFLGCNVPMVVRKVWTSPSRYQRLQYRRPDEDYLKGWAFLQNHMDSETADTLLSEDIQESGDELEVDDSMISKTLDTSDSKQLLGIERTIWTF